MSLLHQNSRDLDDAARGEELTKGTSHVVWAAILATILVTIAIAVYVIAGEKPPAATAAVEQVWAHPMHSESSGLRRQRSGNRQGALRPGAGVCAREAA